MFIWRENMNTEDIVKAKILSGSVSHEELVKLNIENLEEILLKLKPLYFFIVDVKGKRYISW